MITSVKWSRPIFGSITVAEYCKKPVCITLPSFAEDVGTDNSESTFIFRLFKDEYPNICREAV